MQRRERFFECIFAAEGEEYRSFIRAWNAKEALRHLHGELRDSHVQVAGQLRVLDNRGEVLLRCPYAPADAANAPRESA
jgi:hypothetical protein